MIAPRSIAAACIRSPVGRALRSLGLPHRPWLQCLRDDDRVAHHETDGQRQGVRSMSQADVFSVLQNALTLALELSMPMLGIGLVTGVLVSIFQAVTQINDSTLSLVPKIVSVFAALAIFGPWMFHQLVQFATESLTYVPGAGQ
jgi:flagellar biosynthetic protein FliQ